MLSDGKLTTAVTVKNDKGKFETAQVNQEGPIAYVESTTLKREEVFEEDRTRLVPLSVNEDEAQTKAIIENLANTAASVTFGGQTGEVLELHHTAQRLLQPYNVVVPFASKLSQCMPTSVLGARRVFGQLIGFIKAVALLHQFQRTVDQHGNLTATPEDYDLVRGLMEGPLARGLNCDLSEQALRLLSVIKGLGRDFSVADLVPTVNYGETTIRKRIDELIKEGHLEYRKIPRGRTPGAYALPTNLPQGILALPGAGELK